MQKPTVIGNYVIGDKIGEGNYAQVKVATHCLLKQKVALKIINQNKLSPCDVEKILREVKIMKALHHPNLIRLYQVMQDSSKILYMVTEYASGGELYSYLVKNRCMEETQARNVFSQLIAALEFCHSHNVVHRDIKLENLLLDSSGNVKLADFGFSNFFSWDGKLSSWCGSPSYAAPEIFEGREYIGPEVDIWSAGVVLYTLVSGCLPFDGANVQELKQRVIKRIYRIHFRISEECRDIISKMIVYEPAKRYTIPQLRSHSWMQNVEQKSPPSTLQGSDDVNTVRDYVIRNLKANGVDWKSVLEAANNQKFDDWHAMYSILEDQYFKEYVENAPPVLPSETRALPSGSIWFPELQQQSETLRQARDWTCRDLAKVPLSLSSRSSLGSAAMEPPQRIRSVSGNYDTQVALHQQYLNYRRHSMDIFTFQNPHLTNHHNNANYIPTTAETLRTPLDNFTAGLASRRASDSIALQSHRVIEPDHSFVPPIYCQDLSKDEEKGTSEEQSHKFLSSIPPRVNHQLGRRASDGHIMFSKTNNLHALRELPGQENDSEEMLPIPSAFQLSPRQQPRRHSFEPSILLPNMGSKTKSSIQQHLESLYEQALNHAEESDTSSDDHEMAAEYCHQNLGSRLRDLHIEPNNVEHWRTKNSRYMDCVETTAEMTDMPESGDGQGAPRQVSSVNIISEQSAIELLSLVQTHILNFTPAPCIQTEGFAIRASWTEVELCAEVCSVGCKNGLQVQYIRGDQSYYQAVSTKLLSLLTT